MDGRLICKPFFRSPDRLPYYWFDFATIPQISFPEGIESETGEFLYGLVRMARPGSILETGTRTGISTAFMALALKDNKLDGSILTFERDKFCADMAINNFTRWKLADIIEVRAEESMDYDPEKRVFDMLYLDSEPEYRYAELEKFWDNLVPGGMIVIHDLATIDDRAFGGCSDFVRNQIKSGELRAFNFPTCSGLMVMQKAYEIDYQRTIIKGET
jgi:hypothetical protein